MKVCHYCKSVFSVSFISIWSDSELVVPVSGGSKKTKTKKLFFSFFFGGGRWGGGCHNNMWLLGHILYFGCFNIKKVFCYKYHKM